MLPIDQSRKKGRARAREKERERERDRKIEEKKIGSKKKI